jgi:uncharacterized protein YndB with AHSA1/START domain
MIDGSLETIDGRPALRFERRLAHSVERVWRAVTDPAELAEWFVVPVPWTPLLGERFESYGRAGEITELRPPRLIAWTKGTESYRFELRPDAGGCVLVFTHVLDESRGSAAEHAAGWEGYLDRLEAMLAGRVLSEEDAHGSVGERHERYARQFALDPAPGRRTIAAMAFRGLTLEDGPALRLERRFAHGPERVWRALTDPEERAGWFPSGAGLEVTASVRPSLLEGRWHGDRLRFELHADGDGCRLVFTHEFADRATAARTAAGWDRCFSRVDAVLADVTLDEAESLREWLAVHDRYAAAFGVDPELGRRAYAEHPLT